MTAWQVYLLECADGTFYCGITTDIARRMAEHNGLAKGGARYTRCRRPVKLAGQAGCPDRTTALRLEAKIKKMRKMDKILFFKQAGSHAGH